MLEVIANPLAVGAVLVLSLIGAHVLTWRFRDSSTRRILQYVAIGIGGLSIISATLDNQNEIGRGEATMAEVFAENYWGHIGDQLASSQRLTCDSKITKDDWSPDDVDFNTAQLALACDFVKRARAAYDAAPEGVYTRFDMPAGREAIVEPYARQWTDMFDDLVPFYNNEVAARDAGRERSQKNSVQGVLQLFSPYFAALAVSIGLALVSFSERRQAPASPEPDIMV